jgi:spore coat polysaccharide biosynthesis protein SpsF
MKTVIIVQARVQSKRLYGKVLLPVMDRPLLSYLLERLRRVQGVDECVVAIPDTPVNDPLAECCFNESISVFRGANEDVLERLYQAASQYSATCVVRVRGDSPLIDPELVSELIRRFHQLSPHVDYVSNLIKRTYPHGMDVEIFSMKMITHLHQRVSTPGDRENITPYILERLQEFKTLNITAQTDLSLLRWHVSTPEDSERLQRVLEQCYCQNSAFTFADVLTAWDQLCEEQPQKIVKILPAIQRTAAS